LWRGRLEGNRRKANQQAIMQAILEEGWYRRTQGAIKGQTVLALFLVWVKEIE